MNKISISSDNSEVKEILEEIAEVCEELSSSPCVPLEAAEDRMRDLMLRSGQRLLEVCVSQTASQQSSTPVECPECKQPCHPIQKRGVNITTLCGKIRVQRWVYECKSGHYHRPWDACQRLKGKWTHRVAERMCYMAAHFDYRVAAEELSRQGIEVSHTTLHQKVREWLSDLSVPGQVERQTLESHQRWH